jgi:hypothetical protein
VVRGWEAPVLPRERSHRRGKSLWRRRGAQAVSAACGTLGNAYGRRYAVTRDGRVITVLRSGDDTSTEIRLIFNWFEALKSRVPIPD